MTRKNEIKEVLRSIIKGKILCDEPMSLHTSLAVGGNADALVYIENEDQLALVVGRLKEKEINIFYSGKSDECHCAGRWIPGSHIVDDRKQRSPVATIRRKTAI